MLFDSVERAKCELEISFDAIQDAIFLVDKRMRISPGESHQRDGLRAGAGWAKIPPGNLRDRATPYRVSHLDMFVGCSADSQGILMCAGEATTTITHFLSLTWPETSNGWSIMRRTPPKPGNSNNAFNSPSGSRRWATLAAGIAHEIRNPLATISFNTQMLKAGVELNPAQQEMFEDVFQQIRKVDGIIQQVLHFARPHDPQFVPHSLEEVVRHCLDMSKMYLIKAQVEVLTDLRKDLPPIVMDFNQICQVVMNLIINSIEAMPGGGKLKISTSSHEESQGQVLEIHDTGSGILAEDKGRIFDPFFTRKPEGRGWASAYQDRSSKTRRPYGT